MLAILCTWFAFVCPDVTGAEMPPPPIARPAMATMAMAKPQMAKPAAAEPDVADVYVWDEDCALQPPAHLAKAFIIAARRYPSFTACQLAIQAWVESRWIVDAVSAAGAQGIAQLMPATAKDLGVDPFDWKSAIVAMARYRAWCEDRWTPPDFGGRTDDDIEAFGLACYNVGVGFMRASQEEHGWIRYADAKAHLPKETQGYVEQNAGQ